MGNALAFVFLLIVLTVLFKKTAEWFQDAKNINILPAALMEMAAVLVFLWTWGSQYTNDRIWMWAAVAVVAAITVFNWIQYGIKDGTLASLAELIFSISAALLVACILVTGGKKPRKKTRYKRK